MHTPHPSLVPIEMASAGMLCVTSSFENKTPAALAAISPNLIAADARIDAVADALCWAAADAAGDVGTGGLRAARGDWARDWADAFPDALVDRLPSCSRLRLVVVQSTQPRA